MTHTRRRYPTYQELITRALTRYPDREALVDESQRLTGRDLLGRVAQMVAAYREQGLSEGSRIALMAANTVDYAVAQLAAAALGAPFTGIHPLAAPEAVTAVLRKLRPSALIFSPGESAARAQAILDLAPDLSLARLSLGPVEAGIDLVDAARSMPTDSLQNPPRLLTDDEIASISFTGGTTGNSKGVVRSQKAIACSVLTMLAEWDWPSDLRFLALGPLTHATGSIVPAVLIRGGAVHIRNGFDEDDVHHYVAAERITATFLVPTMIYRLLDRPEDSDGDLASLRMIIYGAAPTSAVKLAEGIRRWGKIFMQLYGQVEAPNTICTLPVAAHDPTNLERLGSCGKPTLAIDVELQDPDGSPTPIGKSGELCVRGPLVMDGYLDDPTATAEAFRDGWLRTGDIAFSDSDGYLTIVDRLKDLIVSGGFNVFAGEVERALQGHPLVKECAVIGVPDDDWGEAVAAYVVPTGPAADDSAASLIAHVREKMGPAWSPKRVYFVDSLPVTGLGKPDKKTLRAAHWEGLQRGVH